ncbi:hypothetical protein ABXI76_09965 [Streptomyces parvus]
MSDETIWGALTEQADVWKALPVVRELSSQLPRNNSRANSGVPGRLQHMQACGANIAATPLRLISIVQMYNQFPSAPIGTPPSEAEWGAWVRSAQAVETAHRTTIAWLRSRMHGYPQLPAPQLAPGTTLTASDFSYRLQWQPNERALGFRNQDSPPVGEILQATSAQNRRLSESARTVAAALQASDEWQRLEATHRKLDDRARVALREARARLRRLLAPEAINAQEIRSLHDLHHYREAVQEREIKGLAGVARGFSEAFECANGLVENAASDAFSQLLIYGAPTKVSGVGNLELEPGTPRRASFTCGLDAWLDPGQLVQIDDPLVPEICRVTGVNISLGRVPDRVSVEIINGTAAL